YRLIGETYARPPILDPLQHWCAVRRPGRVRRQLRVCRYRARDERHIGDYGPATNAPRVTFAAHRPNRANGRRRSAGRRKCHRAPAMDGGVLIFVAVGEAAVAYTGVKLPGAKSGGR